MDKAFCKKIDNESLIEAYVKGTLQPELRMQIEAHIQECPVHAQALRLEKLLNRGIQEYARYEMKKKLTVNVHKADETKLLILRFAAILFAAVLIPVLLYFGFKIGRSGSGLPETVTQVRPASAPESEQQNVKNLETHAQPGIMASRAAGAKKAASVSLTSDHIIISPDSAGVSGDIRREIRRIRPEIMKCLADLPEDIGNVDIRFTIDRKGRVVNVRSSADSLQYGKNWHCLDAGLSGLSFRPPGKDVSVHFSLPAGKAKAGPVNAETDKP
jgi:hypothetical protein